MQVSRWGNSLAIRIPASVVQLLELEEGDDIEIEIEIEIAGSRQLRIGRDTKRNKDLEQLKNLHWTLPAGFVFGRDDINDR